MGAARTLRRGGLALALALAVAAPASAATPAAAILRDSAQPAARRLHAALALLRAHRPADVWPSLLRRSGTPLPQALAFLDQLRALRDPAVERALLALLRDGSVLPRLRVAAAQVLAGWGVRGALDEIRKLYEARKVDAVNAARLLDSLAAYRDDSLVEYFKAIMRDVARSGEERVAAAAALIALGVAEAREFVLTVFRQAGGESRLFPFFRLTEILAQMREPRAEALLGARLGGLPHEADAVLWSMRRAGAYRFFDAILGVAADPRRESFLRLTALKVLIDAAARLTTAQRSTLAAAARQAFAQAAASDPGARDHLERLRRAARLQGLAVD